MPKMLHPDFDLYFDLKTEEELWERLGMVRWEYNTLKHFIDREKLKEPEPIQRGERL